MPMSREIRPAGRCTHRPRLDAIPIEPGMWWHAATCHLWIGLETWMDEKAHMLVGCLMVDFKVPGADLCEAIGRVALRQFMRDFPEAVPPTATQITCEVCDHEEGKAVDA